MRLAWCDVDRLDAREPTFQLIYIYVSTCGLGFRYLELHIHLHKISECERFDPGCHPFCAAKDDTCGDEFFTAFVS